MTRSRSANIENVDHSDCVICFREISANLKTTQPLNPRKVFKVCSQYLRPEVFPKYTKWDFLNDLERETPFCSHCVSSGEKLTVLNDRLEELQREIISFVKYFAKEVIRNRASEENDLVITNEGHFSQQVSHPVENGSEKIVKRVTRSSLQTQSTGDTTNNYGENSGSPESIVIKEENEEHQSYFGCEDDDYELSLSTDEEDNDEDTYKPQTSRKRKNSCDNPKKLTKKGVPSKGNQNRIPQQWTEISMTECQLKKDWGLEGVHKSQSAGESHYFVCRDGGRSCPAKMMKKVFNGVRFYKNEKPHHHTREKTGFPRHIKLEILKILEENPGAKPNFIVETLKLKKGISLDSCPNANRKMTNLVNYTKRLKTKKNHPGNDDVVPDFDESSQSLHSGTSDTIKTKTTGFQTLGRSLTSPSASTSNVVQHS